MFWEAALFLGIARFALLVLPFRWIASVFGVQHVETPREESGECGAARGVGAMVNLVAHQVPWQCKCLVQSIAAKLMLSLRHIPSTVYFGVRTDRSGAFEAHAWLRSGESIVVGRTEHEQFTVLTHFADVP